MKIQTRATTWVVALALGFTFASACQNDGVVGTPEPEYQTVTDNIFAVTTDDTGKPVRIEIIRTKSPYIRYSVNGVTQHRVFADEHGVKELLDASARENPETKAALEEIQEAMRDPGLKRELLANANNPEALDSLFDNFMTGRNRK